MRHEEKFGGVQDLSMDAEEEHETSEEQPQRALAMSAEDENEVELASSKDGISLT